MKERTLFEKTMAGLLTGVASLTIIGCETMSGGSSSSSNSTQMGKCMGVSCGGCGKGGKKGCKGGSCGKDGKKGCKGGKKSCKGGQCGGDKHAASGCGKDTCAGPPKAEAKKDYKMMTKKDCESKGGTWSAE